MLRLHLGVLLACSFASACGTIKTREASDAGPDDPDAGAEIGDVTVELDNLFDDGTTGQPWADIPVLFFDKDGALVAEETSDDDGVATATVPAGSTVVLVPPGPEAGERVTLEIFGVQPGDVIRFESLDDSDDGEFLGEMTINVPPLKGEYTYHAANGCSESETSDTAITLSFYSECVEDGEFDVVAWVSDADGGVVDHAVKHDTFVAMDPSNIAEWQGNKEIDLHFTSVPSTASSVRVGATPVSGSHSFGTGMLYLTNFDGPELELTALAAKSFGDAIDIELAYDPSEETLGQQRATYRVTPDTSSLPLPLDAELLPFYGAAVYDASERRLSWTRTSGAAPDGQYVYINAEEKSGDRVEVLAVVPPDWTEVTLPELPEEHEDMYPADPEQLSVAAIGVEVSDQDGYDIRTIGILPFFYALTGRPPASAAPSHVKVAIGGGL